MKIRIENEWCEVVNVNENCIEDEYGREFHIFYDRDDAGEAAENYYRFLAETNPEEFRCIVGDENLVLWCLGHLAGPGHEKVSSLNEWFGLIYEHPEEFFATHDGVEIELDDGDTSEDLIDELGFNPSIAYRAG